MPFCSCDLSALSRALIFERSNGAAKHYSSRTMEEEYVATTSLCINSIAGSQAKSYWTHTCNNATFQRFIKPPVPSIILSRTPKVPLVLLLVTWRLTSWYGIRFVSIKAVTAPGISGRVLWDCLHGTRQGTSVTSNRFYSKGWVGNDDTVWVFYAELVDARVWLGIT